MQTLNTVKNYQNTTLETSGLDSVIEKIHSTRPRLSMKWEKEFDGKRYNLVARWVVED
jgi:hypothetical protein